MQALRLQDAVELRVAGDGLAHQREQEASTERQRQTVVAKESPAGRRAHRCISPTVKA
ncbi:hypothetical protein GCM10010278_36880 [Streptomyces melanogenes]|nr:hypothetical protein GCM10010278_36880 [Streptomyces melanogenes]